MAENKASLFVAPFAAGIAAAVGCWLIYDGLSKTSVKPSSCEKTKISISPTTALPTMPAEPRMRQLYDIILAFSADVKKKTYQFEGLSSDDRKKVHSLATLFRLGHKSIAVETSAGRKKVVVIDKSPPTEAMLTPPGPEPPILRTHFAGSDERKIYQQLQEFLHSDDTILSFPTGMTNEQRGIIHTLAEEMWLDHATMGKKNKFVKVTKVDPKVIIARHQQADQVQIALAQYKSELAATEFAQRETELKRDIAAKKGKPRSASASPLPKDEGIEKSDGVLRYANWNIEWMDFLFESNTEFRISLPDVPSVHDLCENIAGVIRELDPDVIAVEEGPSTIERMQLFVSTFLQNKFLVLGGLEPGQQQLYFLVNKRGPFEKARAYSEMQTFFSREWLFDVSGDCNLQSYKFTRSPLCIAGEVNGNPMFLCCAHTKSKYINGGMKIWKGQSEEERNSLIKKAVKNRRRIAAECARIRKGLDQVIYDKWSNPLVIVSGDLNDGPGMDFFEEYYLLTDSVEQLLGSPFQKKTMLQSLLVRSRWVPPSEQWTCEFDDYIDDVKGKRCLLDHICVSHKLAHTVNRASVAHQIYNHHVVAPGPERGNRPSDHIPVFVDISLDAIKSMKRTESFRNLS